MDTRTDKADGFATDPTVLNRNTAGCVHRGAPQSKDVTYGILKGHLKSQFFLL